MPSPPPSTPDLRPVPKPPLVPKQTLGEEDRLRGLLRAAFRLRPLISALLVLPVLLAVPGCAPDPGPSRDDPFPRGVVRAGTPIVCAPSGQWEGSEGGWSFRGVAEIACEVLEMPAEGGGALVFHFRPDPPTATHAFDLAWDGAPLPEEWRRPADEVAWAVAVPAAELTPGVHELVLTRRPGPGDGDRLDNRFEGLGVALPGAGWRPGVAPDTVPFVAAAAERYAYVADLLLTGVAGLGKQKAGGFLFAGPGSWEAGLPAARPVLDLRLENASAAPARFRVRPAAGGAAILDAEVASGEAVPVVAELSEDLAAHGGDVVFEVEGEAGGLFLWGAPRLLPAAQEEPPAPPPPPIVLVTLDTTRRDVLGAYGGPPGLTPNLDRFAAGATVYDRAASTSSWTLPSHASMFTGLYAGRHGAGVTDHRLSLRLPTLAGELRRRGYQAAGFAGGGLVAHRFGVSRGFDLYRDPDSFETRGDRLSDHAGAFLEARRPGPLFLFVNYFDPHHAYRAPAPFQERTGVPAAREALESPGWRAVAAGDRGAWRGALQGALPVTDGARRWLRAAYEAEVAFMDREVGRLFDVLRQRGIWDDAWIVVVADHGELLGEGGWLSHAYRLDPELVHVPLLVKAPGQRQGRRSAALTSVADLFPTLLAAAGAAPEAAEGGALSWAGRSLDGRFLGEPGDRGRVFYEEHRSRIHVLPNQHLLVAPHLYGVESRPARRVVWDGGMECARWEGEAATGNWRPSPCGDADPAASLSALESRLGDPTAEAAGEASADQLSDEDRAALTALGYL